MKHESCTIVFAILALLLFNVIASGVSLRTVKANTQTTTVQFYNIGAGQTSLTNETTHTSPYAAELVIPSSAPQGSGCMVLYPYNKTLNSLQSFEVYTSYANAVPRFVMLLDTNGDDLIDVVLLSDYQFTSNGNWQITQGGQRWGWTEASPDLSTYGNGWNDTSYWKGIYGNATVLSVGVALEYWAVKDSSGLNQPLYVDELILNGITYNIASTPNQSSNVSTVDDWPMFHHDPQHTGNSASTASDGNLLWQFNTGDKMRSSAAVVNGVVYDGSNNGYVYAFNANTGSVIWQYNSGSQVESSPAVVNGVVYIGILWNGYNGYVCALNAADGSVIWRYATNSGIESSPTVVNGVVYIGSYYGYIYALNANNGALIWSYLTGVSVYSSPAVIDGVVYVGSGDDNVYALNAANGTLIWSFHTGARVYSSPTVVNDIIYVGSDDDNIYALNASNGSQIWHYTTGGLVETSAAVSNGMIYVASSNDGYVHALNATNGQQYWAFHSPYFTYSNAGYVYSSPAVAGNAVYVGSYDGYVFALNAFDGSIIWFYRIGGFLFSSPSVVNGVVYIGSFDGNVYALGTSLAPTSTPTPTPQPTATPISAPTPAPTDTPASDATSQSTATPSATATPAPAPISTTQPATRPMPDVNQNENDSGDWLILGVIIVTAIIAVIFLALVFRRSP